MGKCNQCGECCRNTVVFSKYKPTGDPKKVSEFRGVKIYKHGNQYAHVVPTKPCRKLLKDGKCKLHPRKPKPCKDYPTKTDFLLPGCGYRDDK